MGCYQSLVLQGATQPGILELCEVAASLGCKLAFLGCRLAYPLVAGLGRNLEHIGTHYLSPLEEAFVLGYRLEHFLLGLHLVEIKGVHLEEHLVEHLLDCKLVQSTAALVFPHRMDQKVPTYQDTN